MNNRCATCKSLRYTCAECRSKFFDDVHKHLQEALGLAAADIMLTAEQQFNRANKLEHILSDVTKIIEKDLGNGLNAHDNIVKNLCSFLCIKYPAAPPAKPKKKSR